MKGYLTVNVEGRGLLAKEINSINIPGRDGDYILESKYPPRKIKVHYYLEARNNPEWLEKISKLNYLLQSNDDVIFSFGDENIYRYGRVSSTVDPPYDQNKGLGAFIIYCQDPWNYKFQRETDRLILSENSYPVKIEEISFEIVDNTPKLIVLNEKIEQRIILNGEFTSGDIVKITKDKITVNNRDRTGWLDFVESEYQNFQLKNGDSVVVPTGKNLKIKYREKFI